MSLTAFNRARREEAKTKNQAEILKHADPPAFSSMTKAKLAAYAAEHNIDTNIAKSKAEILSILEARST